MSGSDSIPATPEELERLKDLETPTSPGSEDLSDSGTPQDEVPAQLSSIERPKRVPSLRSVSDPPNMNPSSTSTGFLGRARNLPQTAPSFAGGAGGAMDNNLLERARALQNKRMGMSPIPGSPNVQSPSPSFHGAGPNGLRGLPLQRPGPVPHLRSDPGVSKPSLSERRANKFGMKLSDMGGSSTPPPRLSRPGAPKLSDITGEPGAQKTNGSGLGSKLDDFKKYIDAEKGWITFDGAATITRTGVNFASGQTFSISLDEIQIIDELGKGNYGTVYKVKHAKPTTMRFGQGLSGIRLHQTQSDSSPVSDEGSSNPDEAKDDGSGTTGKTMAMKEIRLELDDAKFSTILKELVILHECVSPHIIDFYGAFFQEGAVYMCIEYMDGGSIDKLYAGGIPESILRKITYSTVMGLKSLKDEHNIIHRDVKPTNILVNTRGQVKICDFGVSGNLVASIAKTNIGCQSYMAPERISGGGMAPTGNSDGSYSVSSDIWSLGLTIIECAMGKYPYPPEVSSTIFSQLSVSDSLSRLVNRNIYITAKQNQSQAIVEGEPPGLPKDGYSETAQSFVQSCLHKIPKMRATYAMLLSHPWLVPFTKPQTIAEEAEEGEEAERVAEAVGKIQLGGEASTEDPEVAAWARAALSGNKGGDNKCDKDAARPALHAAPLDTVSPISSPVLSKQI